MARRLVISVEGKWEDLDFVRTNMVAVVEEVAEEYNEQHPNAIDVGWEIEN